MRRLGTVAVVLAMLLTACSGGATDAGTSLSSVVRGGGVTTSTSTTTTTGSSPLATPSAVLASLTVADSCETLLDRIKAEAGDVVGPWGLDGGYEYPWGRLGFGVPETTMPAAAEDGLEFAAQYDAAGGIAGVDFSGTNVQEVGVDEFDVVKTNGEMIYLLSTDPDIVYSHLERGSLIDPYYGGGAAVLFAIDTTGAAPRLTGSVTLARGWGHEMALAGDTILVVSQGSRPSYAPDAGVNIWEGDYVVPSVGVTLISEIDVSDPADMSVARDLYLDGSYVSGRLVDGVARVVVRSHPTGLEFVTPRGGGLQAERRALEENRQVIEESTIDNWLPYFVLEDHVSGETTEGTLLDCGDVHLPEPGSGLGLTSILSLDTRAGLTVGQAKAAVFASGETVYATAGSLYIATSRHFLDQPDATELSRIRTTIHKFITTPDSVDYQASGTVPGYLLNQWAMSEHDGVLRVASTSGESFWGTTDDSESFITTLVPDGGELVALGSVGGLGRGERIYSVRYLGEVAWVVTFREVDPLYAVDLTDPANPIVRGELKIPGYSAYLHPVGESLLLGVGQDATETGRTLGTQVSLFDISDLDDPRRIDKITITDSNSSAEWDHRAFLYWAPESLVALPLERWSWDGHTDEYVSGALALRVNGDGLTELDPLTHQRRHGEWEHGTQIRRTLVIGDTLFTIADAAIRTWSIDNLDMIEELELG